MKTTTNYPQETQSDLPPSDWRVVDVRPRPTTRAGSFIAARYRVDPAVADMIAEAAGLGSDSYPNSSSVRTRLTSLARACAISLAMATITATDTFDVTVVVTVIVTLLHGETVQ